MFHLNKTAKYILIFLVAFSLFAWLQSAPTFPDPDSFYHAKMAVLMRENGIIKTFPWLNFTVIKNTYTDHHLIYHLILIPFTTFLNPLAGLKLATILLASLFIFTFYWFLKNNKIKYPAFFTLLLLAINPFVFRLNLAKTSALSLIILILSLHFIFQKKYWPLFFLSFFYVWTYGGWPLLPLLAGFYFLAALLRDVCPPVCKNLPIRQAGAKTKILNLKSQIANLRPLWNTVAGSVCGLIINPYFPQNIQFYWYQIVEIAIINFKGKIGVGGEWYAYKPLHLINNASLIFILLTITLVIFAITIKKQSRKSIFLFFVMIVFIFLTFKSRRNVEYFAPFAVLFSAFSFTAAWNNYKKELTNFFNEWRQESRKISAAAILILAIAFIFIITRDINLVKKDFTRGFSATKFQAASIWLKKNTPPGSIIFHNDWDDFPFLFYNNHHNYYIVGLDPTFMYLYNKKLYSQWEQITLGNESKNLYYAIKNNFNADYVFLDKHHQKFEKNLIADSNFIEVYNDNEASIYRTKF